MSTPRILSPRALQELMKGNHKNLVSIKVDDEIFLQIHRPVAKRFSSVWNRALSNLDCRTVTVTFLPDAPPPWVGESEPKSGNGPMTSEPLPPPPPLPSHKNALKFIVQWMEQGGADPNGKNAVPYPTGYREGLWRLLALAEILEVNELVTRVIYDLNETPLPKLQNPIPRPKKCPKCRRIEHPGQECQSCWMCHEIGHRKFNCPKAHQAYLERQARREQKAEDDRRRLEWEEEKRIRAQEKQERYQRHKRAYMIHTGQLAVGDGDKTFKCWN